MGRRRLGQLAAVVLLGTGMLTVGGGRAHAATSLEVQVGFAGGGFLPGRAARVRVAVAADRLVRGTLEVRLQSGPSIVVTRPVEVPGGSTKEVVVAVPTFALNVGGPSAQVTVALRDDGGVVAESTRNLQQLVDAELVGALAGARAAASLPETAALSVDAGTARFAAVDDLDLAEPGALDALDMLAVLPAELGALGGEARQHVLTWIGDGGRLVVVGSPGDPIPGLPDAWQPRTARRTAASAGEVAYASGTPAAWFRGLEPTPTRSLLEDGGMGRPWMTVPVAAVLARDAGVRAARVGWLVGFLVAYVVAVGPAAYLVLRRLGRPMLLWAVVPGLAVLFTAGGWLAGRSLRSGADAAHATIVETRPSGARATTWVGVASRGGGGADVRFGTGWVPVASSSLLQTGGDASARFTTGGAPVGRVQLAAGGFGTSSASGEVAFQGALEIVASSPSDGVVEGTVRNTTAYALDPVRAFTGHGHASVGALAPGETRTFRISGASDPLVFNGAVADAWDTFDPMTGRLTGDQQVNTGAWDELVASRGANWASGPRVLVAGWTRGADAPVQVRGRTPVGRTAIVADAEVAPAIGGRLTDRSIARAVVRGGGGMMAPPSGTNVLSFTLPAGARGDGLALRTGPGVTGAAVWLGGSWTPLAGAANGFPAEAFVDGRAFVRIEVQQNGPFLTDDAFLTSAEAS